MVVRSRPIPVAAIERGNLMAFAVGTGDTLQLRVHNPDSHPWQWIDLGTLLP
jgi:hypothetical protein